MLALSMFGFLVWGIVEMGGKGDLCGRVAEFGEAGFLGCIVCCFIAWIGGEDKYMLPCKVVAIALNNRVYGNPGGDGCRKKILNL